MIKKKKDIIVKAESSLSTVYTNRCLFVLYNKTILSYFGGQNNFIFKIVLLDRFDCIRKILSKVGLTGQFGFSESLLQDNPIIWANL